MRKISLPDHGAIHCGKGVKQAKGGGRGSGELVQDLLQSWRQLKWKRKWMKCAHHDDDEADDGDDPTHAPFACCNPAHPPPPLHSYLRPAASAAIVVAVNATVKLSFCLTSPPPPVPCCQHVLLLRRLFALKILFIAIARICTKIFYNAGQQHRDGCRKGWGGEGRRCQKGDKADNEIVVTQFGNDGQKKKNILEYEKWQTTAAQWASKRNEKNKAESTIWAYWNWWKSPTKGRG